MMNRKKHNTNYNLSTISYDEMYAYDVLLLLFSAFYKGLTKYTYDFFYHSDYLGSSSWITDASDTANQHLQYLPFGESFIDQRATDHDIRFKFTGKERDSETGFDYFGARYYSSGLSVWLSVDPLSDMYPSTSPFMYVRGNPIMLVDPTGMSDERFGVGTRFSNWIKGDGWKNKANKFIAKNNFTSTANADGSITATTSKTWQRIGEQGAESGLNNLICNFSEGGYSLTTISSATLTESTQSFSYESINNSILNSNITLGLLGTLNLIGDASKQALRSTANFLKTASDLGVDKTLKNVVRFSKGTGLIAAGINTIINGGEVINHWNSPDRGYYLAKATTSLAITAINAVPIIGAMASVVLGAVEADGGFDGLYNKFK